MQRRGSRSPSIATPSSPVESMSSITVQSSRSEEAPFGLCPSCRLPILKLKNGTVRNRDRWFYKCLNYQKDPRCRFYMWEEEFESFVDGARGVTVSPDVDVVSSLDSDLISRIEERFDNMTEELKKKCHCDQRKSIKALVALVDNMKGKLELFCGIIVILMIALLIMLVSVLVVVIGK